VRSTLVGWRREAGFALGLRVLPAAVAAFQWRARRLALSLGDEFSLASATRPAKLAALLEAGRGARIAVELGTATGWTTASLALADPSRQVISFDPVAQLNRERYLTLAGAAAQARIRLVQAPGEAGPEPDSAAVELLYVDSSHTREGTLREWHAWAPALAPDAVIVFDDYDHPDFPGVRQAVEEVGLSGAERAGLFVARTSRA
jgi:predicted O-methyltransferase YrrM